MDFGTALGIAIAGRTLRAKLKPKAEMNWQADYPAEDVFDALRRVIDRTDRFILCGHFPAEKKMLLECEKTRRSKGEEVMVLVEATGEFTCEIFMVSQSRQLEDDYGKNQENLRILSDMLLDEYMALSDDEEYETLRMFRLGYLTEEEYKSIVETDRWWKENRMDDRSAEVVASMKKEDEPAQKCEFLEEFPETDEKGFYITSNALSSVYGVSKEYNGFSAQDAIRQLRIYERVFLKIENDEVCVYTQRGRMVGYAIQISAKSKEILKEGGTVLARVEVTGVNDVGIQWLSIRIASYNKIKKKK